MSLVTDPSRKIAPISLIQAPSGPSEGSGALEEVAPLMRRAVETYFAGLTGVRTVAHIDAAETRMGRSDEDVFRAIGWDANVPPITLAFPRSALALLVDRFYGGGGTIVDPTRPVSASEDRFFDRIARGLAPLIGSCWKSFVSINPVLTTLPAVDMAFTASRLTIECGDWAPIALEVGYAPETLSALADHSDPTDELRSGEETWAHDLTALALNVPFPVRTILAEPEILLARLTRLSVGDVLPIRVAATMDLCIEGIRIAKGTVGDHDGRAAFRID